MLRCPIIRKSAPAAFVLAFLAGTASACPPPDAATDPWGPAVVPAAAAEPATITATSTLYASQPVVQLAILLDTSGSMEGLINQARARIWDVVNDLAKAHRHGKRARLEVALYQYGSGDLPSSEGFLTLVQPFTTDLDMISERLFSLRVGGSAEYCGWAMKSALAELSWDSTPLSTPRDQQPLRVMVIAGNEPFTQGPVEYQSPARRARARGVVVNTVYCGNHHEGVNSGWHNAAQIGRGAYLSIDQNAPVEQVHSPHDDEILRLNTSLNATYLPYGQVGQAFGERQVAQDRANRDLSKEGAVKRAATKSSVQYRNDHWDLIDAVRLGTVDLASAPTESLPDSLRAMTVDERQREVERLRQERDRIQSRIRVLAAERDRWVRTHSARPADTLDAAMIRAIREQARRLGFAFDAD